MDVTSERVVTITITLDREEAKLLRDFLDPTKPYVHLEEEESLKRLLWSLKSVGLQEGF